MTSAFDAGSSGFISSSAFACSALVIRPIRPSRNLHVSDYTLCGFNTLVIAHNEVDVGFLGVNALLFVGERLALDAVHNFLGRRSAAILQGFYHASKDRAIGPGRAFR